MRWKPAYELIQRWVVYANNYCNFACTECSAFCNQPFGANNFRDKPWEIDITHLKQFLTGLPNHRFEIRLTGGEPTALPVEKLTHIIHLIHDHGHEPGLTTNCYGLLDLDDDIFALLRNLDLDDHGSNFMLVNECIEKAEKFGIPHRRIQNDKHYIIDEAIELSQGRACSNWVHLPSMYDGVIYPCCNSMLHKGGDLTLREKLIDMGLHVSNKYWYKKYAPLIFPREAHENCLYSCWLPGGSDATWVKISNRSDAQIRSGG